jgi:hypothetical protein
MYYFFTSFSALAVHWLVRMTLGLHRSLPFRLMQFLAFAAERVILVRSGPSYLFVHRSMIEHFAITPYVKDQMIMRRAIALGLRTGLSATLQEAANVYLAAIEQRKQHTERADRD